MSNKQKTILKAVTVKGSGLHTGQNGHLTFKPAPANHGVKFKRIDLGSQPVIDADIQHVVSTDRGTTIAQSGTSIYTIEHVLAALSGMRVDNALASLRKEGSASIVFTVSLRSTPLTCFSPVSSTLGTHSSAAPRFASRRALLSRSE